MGWGYYIIGADGEKQEASREEWSAFIEKMDRQIARDELGDDVLVSTVMMGLDAWGDGYVWETMILGGAAGGWQVRAQTRAEAMQHHAEALAEAHRVDTKYWRRRAERGRQKTNRGIKRWPKTIGRKYPGLVETALEARKRARRRTRRPAS